MIVLLCIVLLTAIVVFLYMRQQKFGKAPSGKRLELIKKSPHYKDGQFQNIHFTPTITEGYSTAGVTYDFLFKSFPRRTPADSIPSIKTDLLQLNVDSNVLVWFGHSSYFMQIGGKRFLIDPVFSGNASPIPRTNKSFKGTDIYHATDMPDIDYLLITHDHYDHLDYETILALKGKVKHVICGLGVGEHFEQWGFDVKKIIEKDWNDSIPLGDGFVVHTAPARHFSGRGFTRNNTLWLSYVLQTPNLKVYIGGDSGYDNHFADIGKQYGPIDLAILDNGQYNVAWQAIHMLPEEVLKAAQELRAKRIFPVHSSKFVLALHPWDEPLMKITALSKSHDFPLVTPMIGQEVNLNDTAQVFSEWWKGLN
ncbi:MBL fold metallo-hydrolase [Olivibacter domesticus]|uniref:L-ascorbate metabolism protein UlaG, beta-lactamase superfamily n=1 Tax=Olivibacter domesticus TaxID=407022 RepID=A0A1H7W1S8_OLID1|nr:MBL fold metallo-hydrolase [Olivibacter domesticus]SEM15466.1 L-ascorbate metabolism protein UlaG, beta-lactamase superfamily [Olivibacter domesticus]